MVYYVCPLGKRYLTCPRNIKLKSGKMVSLPKGISDKEWLQIPGCKILQS